jgi:hypothetical protein
MRVAGEFNRRSAPVASHGAPNPLSQRSENAGRTVDYDVKIVVDYLTNMYYVPPSSLMEGRLLETILKAERGVASCGRGS